MLQISNLDETKPEWSLNETHIIIPMLDGDILANRDADKSVTSTITLNPLDGGDQTILTGGLEHSLVIGLDRNLFETHNNKSDLFVIQNSDLKLLSYGTEAKNSVAYALSYIDQDKSEIIWENSLPIDKNKPDWYSNDKTIFEVKDVLSYEDSIEEPTKTWEDELERNEQISLVDDLTTQISKIGGSLLVPVDDTLNDDQKSDSDIVGNSHFIVNYFPTIQGNETFSYLPNHAITIIGKQSETEHEVGLKCISTNIDDVQNDLLITKIIEESQSNNFESEGSKTLLHVHDTLVEQDCQKYGGTERNEVEEEEEGEENYFENDEVHNLLQQPIIKNDTLDTDHMEAYDEEDKQEIEKAGSFEYKSIVLENSLPLKKKSKMKRTIALSCNDTLEISNQSNAAEIEEGSGSSATKKLKYSSEEYDVHDTNSVVPLANLVTMKQTNLIQTIENGENKVAENKSSSDSLVCLKNQKKLSDELKPESAVYKNKSMSCAKTSNSEKNHFNSVFDLLENLKSTKVISKSVLQTLQTGLKEMDVDVMKEILQKEDEETPSEELSYSAQLKAFGLVLYFKQPTAFKHLAKMYEKGWPSLDVIKDWKRKVNSYQKPIKWRTESKKL